MPTVCLHDKKVIERFFRKNPDLHIYSIGDLDDFFWPYTTWYSLLADDEPLAIALLYSGQELPTLLAFADPPEIMLELIESIIHLLPVKFYAHLSPSVEDVFKDDYDLKSGGRHHKMALNDRTKAGQIDSSTVSPVSVAEGGALNKLYDGIYPGNWFDQRMLETGQYFGIRKNGSLVSVAGIHVYSENYRVAALGNVATHPAWREKGFGTLVTARLCQSLVEKIDHIGLNVKADNTRAISLYHKLGFEIIAEYGEFTITKTQK